MNSSPAAAYDHFPCAALAALDRERSKQFFVARLDHERLHFVQQLGGEGDCPSAILDPSWRTLHQFFHLNVHAADDSVDAAALGLALAGGRVMHQSAESMVTLIRPDLVPVVADALQSVNLQRLREFQRAELADLAQSGDISAVSEFEPLMSLAERVQQFYRQAQQSSAAVAFAAWSKP